MPPRAGVTVRGYCTRSASTIKTTHIVPAITYSHFHDMPAASMRVRIAGPMIAPTPKNPSTVFMIDVCCAVDVEMSPISASAPVLNTPIASPDTPSITAKNENVSPAARRKHAAAKSVRPMTIVGRRPNRSASCPSIRPASAIPVIVAY